MTKELLQQALEALITAEAGLADIGDADREPTDDLVWCEERAAQALAKPRAAITAIKEALALPVQPVHHPQHSHTLQEMYAELHLYEEINQHYAKCNPGAANLRDWVAERMDKPVQPCPVLAEREACAKVCEKHAEVYAGLEQNSTTQSAWAACIDSRDAIRARGQA